MFHEPRGEPATHLESEALQGRAGHGLARQYGTSRAYSQELYLVAAAVPTPAAQTGEQEDCPHPKVQTLIVFTSCWHFCVLAVENGPGALRPCRSTCRYPYPDPREDPKSRTPNLGFQYSYRVDDRTLRCIYLLDPPRVLGSSMTHNSNCKEEGCNEHQTTATCYLRAGVAATRQLGPACKS